METRSRVLCLERVGEGGHRLAVRLLKETPLRALDLDDAAEIAGIDEQLLCITLAPPDHELARGLVQGVDEPDQLERAEGLVQDRARTCLAGVRLGHLGPGQENHVGLRARGPVRQLSAERESVQTGQRHVEEDDRGSPEACDLPGLLCRSDFLDLELVSGESLAQEQPQRGVVVDDQDAPARA